MPGGHSRQHSRQYSIHASPQTGYMMPARLEPTEQQLQMQYNNHHSYNRDPFPPSRTKAAKEAGARAWAQEQGVPSPHQSIFASPSFHVPPQSTTSNVAISAMPLPYDPSRRRSIGAGDLPQYSAPTESSLYTPRGMPPPSPPPSAAIPTQSSGPHGPPSSSLFAGIRDLANLSSNRRSGNGMSISSILGNAVDERKAHPTSMRPPSPGRARASSMREPYTNGFREASPRREMMEPKSASAAIDPGRAEQDRIQRESTNGFRAFYPGAYPGRPSSQPSEHQALASDKVDGTARLGMFRSFASVADPAYEPRLRPSEGWSQAADRSAFSSPGANKEHRDVFSPAYSSAQFGPPIREEQASLFRPAYPTPLLVQAHESIESKTGRATPPSYLGYRSGFYERPITYEEHQRMEAQRKDSDGSVPRSIFNISPELRRRGRDSPLPQAVQGAQPRHIGPGGDHPSIKSEFGRMFSGLGSGVGSATPVGGQSMNGNGTPLRIGDAGDYVEDADDLQSASAIPRKTGIRRPRDDLEFDKYDGRMTPSLSQRGKRAKTANSLHHHHHHHHHAHHHHHESPEQQAGSYNMIRFPSNPLSQSAQSSHRHHHHHHAHPAHHHHHVPRPAVTPKKPAINVHNNAVLQSIADKPRSHLGSMPYRASAAASGKTSRDVYSSTADMIPKFEGKENCTYTLRIPRWYVAESSRLEAICTGRRLWGSDIYTDDSDVIAAAVHSGWIRGDFGYATSYLRILDGDDEPERERDQLQLLSRPVRPASIPAGHDMHVTILVVPPLEEYASTHRYHIRSREWSGAQPHDGMSFMIHKIEFVDEGTADRGIGRDAASRKARIAMEERQRREAAAALLMLPGLAEPIVSVGA